MTERSDEELVCAFQAGEENAFAEVYDGHKSAVQRTAYLIVGNHSDSENILQDTFVKAWQNLSSLKDPSRFEPWLMRIMVRTAWQYCRKRRGEQAVADLWESVPEGKIETVCEQPIERILQIERQEELWSAVNRLDMKHRTVVILYYYNEMSVQEIATATGTLAGTVKSRLFTARKMLRQQMDKAKAGR